MGSPFYDEGVIAAVAGLSEADNPYDEGTDAFADWNEGFARGLIVGAEQSDAR